MIKQTKMNKFNIKNTKDLENLKESLNNVLDKKIEEARLNEGIRSVSKMSFNEINTIFESVLDRLYDTDNGKKIIGKYVSSVKGSSPLRECFLMSKAILNESNNSDTDILINEISQFSSNLNRDVLYYDIDNLAKLAKAAIRESKISASELEEELSEYNNSVKKSIDYIIENKKKMSNVGSYVGHLSNIKKYINESKKDEETVSESVSLTDLEKLFENSYSRWENEVIKDVTECTLKGIDKSTLFENYKKECLDTIEECMNTDNVEEKSRLSSLMEGLSNKTYNSETINDDLFKLAELKETLKDQDA